MADNITKGKLAQIRGAAREESSKVTGNKSGEIKGKAEKAGGKVQEEFGKAQKNIEKAIEDYPD